MAYSKMAVYTGTATMMFGAKVFKYKYRCRIYYAKNYEGLIAPFDKLQVVT